MVDYSGIIPNSGENSLVNTRGSVWGRVTDSQDVKLGNAA